MTRLPNGETATITRPAAIAAPGGFPRRRGRSSCAARSIASVYLSGPSRNAVRAAITRTQRPRKGHGSDFSRALHHRHLSDVAAGARAAKLSRGGNQHQRRPPCEDKIAGMRALLQSVFQQNATQPPRRGSGRGWRQGHSVTGDPIPQPCNCWPRGADPPPSAPHNHR